MDWVGLGRRQRGAHRRWVKVEEGRRRDWVLAAAFRPCSLVGPCSRHLVQMLYRPPLRIARSVSALSVSVASHLIGSCSIWSAPESGAHWGCSPSVEAAATW